MGRALAAAIVASLLAVTGAGGAGAANVQTPRRGGTVVVWTPGGSFEPACLNPLLARCGSFLLLKIEHVLPGAFGPDPDRPAGPTLVSSGTVTKTAPFTATFHIRQEARWSDGVPITAKDFVFTQRALRRFPSDQAEFNLTKVRSVRALDSKTLRVVLRSRFAGWKLLFPFVLPEHALRGEDLAKVWDDEIDSPKTGAPIASGAFLLDHWDRGKQFVLRRNPRFWGPHAAYLDRLVIRFDLESGADVVDALRSDQLDVYDARLTDIEPELLQVPDVKHRYGPGQNWEHLDIRIGDGGHPALEKKLVRRALAYGLDRKAIVRAIFGRFVPKLQPVQSAVLLPQATGYKPNWSVYRYRPAQSRRLLAQAGCKRGSDGIYGCAGQRLSLRFFTTAGGANRSTALELEQRQLRQAGIEATPQYMPSGALFNQVLAKGDFDVAEFAYIGFTPLGLGDLYGCGGAFNSTGYCQRLTTSDLAQADRNLDAVQRAKVLNRADRRLVQDVPVIPLWVDPISVTYRSGLHGVVPCFPSQACNAQNWWVER